MTHVLLAVHMLFVNILLMNLLIAMFRYACILMRNKYLFRKCDYFSKRYEEVHVEVTQIWHYQRYLFNQEQYGRVLLVPPLSTIIIVTRLLKILYNISQRCRNKAYLFEQRHFSEFLMYSDIRMHIILRVNVLRNYAEKPENCYRMAKYRGCLDIRLCTK